MKTAEILYIDTACCAYSQVGKFGTDTVKTVMWWSTAHLH